jgi:hypothetical protein
MTEEVSQRPACDELDDGDQQEGEHEHPDDSAHDQRPSKV